MKKLTLNDNTTIDIIGSGTNTFGKENHDYTAPINMDTTEIIMAIKNGYRHFDTAISYRNESVLGKGLKESGLSREEVYITTKIPGRSPHFDSKEAVRDSIESSLKALDTDYIDLYLIHKPWDNSDAMFMMWQELEKAVDEGIIKSIGVSNFNENQLKDLYDRARIKPSINQIESHPGFWNHDLIEYAQNLGVAIEAWGPLTRVSETAKKVLSEIGQKYNKSWAQIILRYQIERDVIVIPKSHNSDRQKANLDIFDFTLTDEEKEAISRL